VETNRRAYSDEAHKRPIEVQLDDKIRVLRSQQDGVYGEIREYVTSALDRSRGTPPGGGRGPQSGPWKAGPHDSQATPELGIDRDLSGLVDRQY